MTAPTSDEAVAMTEVLDKVLGPMPIYATRIGYRDDSTGDERRLGDFLFTLARSWEDFKNGTETAAPAAEVVGDASPASPTGDAVEAAARAMFETPDALTFDSEPWTWDDVLREEPDRAEIWREDARRVLAAAGRALASQREDLIVAGVDPGDLAVPLHPGVEVVAVRACRVCGCTDEDCSGCIARTGEPCHWVEVTLCSACEVAAGYREALMESQTWCPACGGHGVIGTGGADIRDCPNLDTHIAVDRVLRAMPGGAS